MGLRSGKLRIAMVAVLIPCFSVGGAATEGGKVYTGPEGIQVTIVDLAPRSQNQAIVLIRGTKSELEGKALLHEVSEAGDRTDYRTQLHGRDWVTVVVRSNWGTRQFLLGVPGRKDDISLQYDEKRTQELKAEEIYALHQKQIKDGSLTALQAFDRRGAEARHDKEFGEALTHMNQACGTQITGAIEWKSISEDLLKEYSISSFCENPISALQRLCQYPSAKAIIQRKVKTATCEFGVALELTVKDGALRWITAPKAANQEEFATKYFEKNL